MPADRPPPPASPRPGPSPACVRLPTDKVVSCLFGAGRLGRAREPLEESEGWWWWHFDGLDGDSQGVVGVHPDDTQALAGLERLRSNPRGLCELEAIVIAATALDGRGGEWCLERVASLLYGPRDQRRSHRERQLPGIKAVLALCERGIWHLDGRTKRASTKGSSTKGKAKGTSRPPMGGEVSGHLVSIVAHSRARATISLAPGLAERAHGGPGIVIPAKDL
ncbi:MAG: hypothetical protein ACRD0J_02430, partial [Acidimicrobiales bacterium]